MCYLGRQKFQPTLFLFRKYLQSFKASLLNSELKKPRNRRRDNSKADLTELGFEDVGWIDPVEEEVQ
jgi:hypothetical protein